MTFTELIYLIFFLISFIFLICFSIYAVFIRNRYYKSQRSFSLPIFYTVGVFIAIVLVFIPLYYTSYNFGDNYNFLRPLLLSVHHALKVFILDSDYADIRDAITSCCQLLRTPYSLYCVCLFIIAPVMTLTTVLSLFKNFKAEIRYRFCGNKNLYIFSELNECSLALAKSIKNKSLKKQSVIVFTDVYEQNDEISQEMILEANNLNSICLKRDVCHLNITAKKGNAEIFLLGKNESENISQASILTNEFNKENKKQNIKVFVFSSRKESGYIIDSLNYDSLICNAENDGFSNETFKIRRVDTKKQLVWRTVPKMGLVSQCNNDSKTISVMIAGIGSFGTEFFKMLVWYCQMAGYSLELNIFDKIKNSENNAVESILSRQCPELFLKNPCNDDGEAHYDIKCFDGIDFNNNSFEKLWDKEENIERLGKTAVVIVALGNDDVNIETAVYLRTIFDRKYQINADSAISEKDERPQIYSIVYDGVKSGLINGENFEYLKNYKEIPYHIKFIGNIEQQYSYDNIYDTELENKAFQYHIEWLDIQEKQDNTIIFKKEKRKYEQYEYYRLSSMAKALHKEAVKKKYENNKIDDVEILKKIEHCRWNAYMRTEGYVYGLRADRALQHNDLVDWNTLIGRKDGEDEKDK